MTIDIEYHDDNSFHTTYKVTKYPEVARKLEHALREQLLDEGIDHRVTLNAGPPKGYVPFWNCKNWFASARDPTVKVRYPRLGAFEVSVKTPSGFAPPDTGLPQRFDVWSKLNTRRWPDPEQLAHALTKALALGRDQEDVMEHMQLFKAQCAPASLATSPVLKITSHPPMFFGLTPREHIPTPVARLSPEERKGESLRSKEQTSGFFNSSSATALPASPKRPASALVPTRGNESRPLLASPIAGKIRPSSAKQIRSVAAAAVAIEAAESAVTPQLELSTSPSVAAASDVAGYEDLPSFRQPKEVEKPVCRPSGDRQVANSDKDGAYDEDFEEDEVLARKPQPLEPESAVQESVVQPPTPSQPPKPQPLAEELARRLLHRYGAANVPRELLLKGRQPVPNFSDALDLDSFKSQLYHLGVFSQPFNFGGLFTELNIEQQGVSLGILEKALMNFWPQLPPPSEKVTPIQAPVIHQASVPAPEQPAVAPTPSTGASSQMQTPPATTQPTISKKASEDWDDYDGDEFEESNQMSDVPANAPVHMEVEDNDFIQDQEDPVLSQGAQLPIDEYDDDELIDVTNQALSLQKPAAVPMGYDEGEEFIDYDDDDDDEEESSPPSKVQAEQPIEVYDDDDDFLEEVDEPSNRDQPDALDDYDEDEGFEDDFEGDVPQLPPQVTRPPAPVPVVAAPQKSPMLDMPTPSTTVAARRLNADDEDYEEGFESDVEENVGEENVAPGRVSEGNYDYDYAEDNEVSEEEAFEDGDSIKSIDD